MRIVRITDRTLPDFQGRLEALERETSYPLGGDSFQISHGADYLAFFRRLGRLRYYAALDGDRLAAVSAAVHRTFPAAWYLGDLKVHPDYRGRGIPFRLGARMFLPLYLRCRRGYGISMNPGDGSPNRVVRLGSRFRRARFSAGGTLVVYSLDAEAIRRVRPAIERHRGAASFLSLRGRNDLVLRSTGSPLPLLHVQFGLCAEAGEPEPREGFTHMFCTPEGDALDREARALGESPSASATVLHHGMEHTDWSFVLTSDI